MTHKPQGYKYKSLEAAAVDLHRNVEAVVLKAVTFDPDGPIDRAMSGKRRVTVDLSVMRTPKRDTLAARRVVAIERATGVWVRQGGNMDKVKMALICFLVDQGYPPVMCWTCTHREQHTPKRGRGYWICGLQGPKCPVGAEDSCDSWKKSASF